VVPPYSVKMSRVPTYSFVILVPHKGFRIRGFHSVSRCIPTTSTNQYAKYNRSNPFSLAATDGISIDFSSFRY
jgi:hypothetical protein